ncbi:peptidoglycan DD-metalloendopeptidase family protein [Streptomyces triculaminicus]|uniref:peptidoglycan DD-metalloendopeptidase family protein n=1 Tax=Streptomyces triculaminicus TaxID=2816232 RepID=UPI0037D96C43
MASNRPDPDGTSHDGYGTYDTYDTPGTYGTTGGASAAYETYDGHDGYGGYDGYDAGPQSYADADADADSGEPASEWNPSEDSLVPPARGRHRVVKQRGGTMARSGAVLGVGMIAAVGAGGMASAQDRPAAPISVPELAQKIPGVGTLMTDGEQAEGGQAQDVTPAAVASTASTSGESAEAAPEPAHSAADAGEVLRARILQQAERQQGLADDAARESEERAAAESTRKVAAQKAEAHEAQETNEVQEAQEAEQAGKAEKAAQAAQAVRTGTPKAGSGHAEAGREAVGAAAGGQESARRAARGTTRTTPVRSYVLPLGSYTLTAGFGQAGDMWSANHTGEDFAAPTGTPVKAVGGGRVTQAGWAGPYGYRIVLTLDDGTQIWYCHLSSMVVTSGKVGAGTVIGRVGATGNVTGAHLHLEVRPGGGSPIDPLSWLRGRGLRP